MSVLCELLASFGHSDVRTHLQSGNLVLTSDATPAQLEHKVKEQILKGLGLDVSVLVRTRDELANVIECDPFGEFADDPKRYQVSFLSAEPDAAVVGGLGAVDFSPERVVVSGREIYAWHPNGIQRSPLAQLLTDRHLGVTATARNWNTIIKLLALADE